MKACVRTLLTTALVVSALTACGTTVPGAASVTSGDGLGAAPAAVNAPDGTSSTSGSAGGVAAPSGSSSLGTPSSGNRSTAPTAAAGTGGPGTTSGGVGAGTMSKTPVGVLFFYVNGGNKVLSTVFPGSSVSFGDGKGEANAVIADINAHGGINGRPIKPYFVPIEATKADDNTVGAACAAGVQDNHPMAILSIFNISRPLVACATTYHVLLIDVALGAGDDGVYRSAPELAFSPTQISRDLEQQLVLGLAHTSGELSAKTPVGVLYETDDPQFGAVVSRTVLPLLKGWGVPTTVATISSPTDSSGMSAAVLKFSSSGVKAVTFSLGSGGVPEALFMTNANQQAFTPRYLMGDSTNTSFVESAAPRAQVQNISGAGTYPLANVAAGDYPSSPGEVHCLQVLNKTVGGYRNRGSSLTGTLACELLYGFQFVAKRAQGELTAASFVAAYRSVGRAYPALTTFASDLTAARNDNAALYRSFAYQAACSCIKYNSAAKAITAVTG